MSSDLLNAIFYKKISSLATIHLNSKSYQKTNYLFLLNLFQKSEYELKIINFDPLFYRFFLSYKEENKIYKLQSDFTFYTKFDEIQNTFTQINKNSNIIIIIGLNLLGKEKIKEFFYNLNLIKSSTSLSKIIFISFDCSNQINDLINNNCLFSLNEVTNAKKKDKLYIKYEFYNHKKLTKDHIIFSFDINDEKGIINNFEDILMHNLELQKIFNEVEKPIEHKTQMNLNLTEEERKAKNELILPFIKTNKEKKDILDNNNIVDDKEEVEIEEDPDDDLDV